MTGGADNHDPDTAGFYDDLADHYHRLFIDWPAAVERQGKLLDRLIAAAIGPGPHRVLDVAAGIGTQALGLAARGHRLGARDLSARAIARAGREAAARGLAIDCSIADMRQARPGDAGAFDAVLAGDNALPHLDSEADLLRAGRAMLASLRPGGLLLASIRDYDAALADRPSQMPASFSGPPERRRIVHQVWDWRDERRYDAHIHIAEFDGARWRCDHFVARYRALRRAELSALLARAGATEIAWHAADETGFHQPIVTARRR